MLASTKKEQLSFRSPMATCGTRLPSAVSQLPPPPRQRWGDRHLLPPVLEAMPLPTRPRGASAAPRFRGGSASRLGCPPLRTVVIEPGLKTPMVALETPRPRGPAAPAAVSPQTPSSGSDRRAAAGFPPADIPVVVTSVAPPPPALAGSSPFGRSWSCHPRVPLGEGWKRQ